MLTCHLERESEIPLYEQLYNFIKKEIMEGRITYGSKLPSKRKLADFLKISQNTIEQAYDQLVAEGYIEAKPRKGYFVLASEDLEYVQPARTIQEYQIEKKQIRYDFHPSWIDTEHFPFAKWRKYAKDIITKDNQELLLFRRSAGRASLKRRQSQLIFIKPAGTMLPTTSFSVLGLRHYCNNLFCLWEIRLLMAWKTPVITSCLECSALSE
uniref:GntR family transcriptional regulator n=1 Tax=Flavobacterium myungsuense TaxID=651823 RepID=UPI0036D290D6